jgi:IclR family transcriptional regulator, KDG regulon repressor
MSKTVQLVSQIFSQFSIEIEEISVREVSKKMKVYPSRIQRLLSALEAEGFLERTVNHKYRLGEVISELGALVPIHSPLRKIVRPHAEELAGKYRINVQVGIPSKKDPPTAIIIDRVINFQSSASIQRIAFNIPLHCSGIGKTILAFMPLERQKVAFQQIELIKYTKNTIVDPKLLKEEMKTIVKNGFAIDRGEMHENVYCVAAPLFHNEELVGAISITDTEEKVNTRTYDELSKIIREKANFISRQL